MRTATAAVLGQIALLALALVGGPTLMSGCSLTLFQDECESNADCDGGLICRKGLCVALPTTVTDTAGGDDTTVQDTTETPVIIPGCPKVYGVPLSEALSSDTVLIGSLLPNSGSLGVFGPPIDQAIELAIEEINQAGGIFGKKLGVLACDTATDPEAAKVVAQHMADLGIPAIIGAAASSITIEVFTQVAKDAGVLMISPASTSPSITNQPDDDLLWRTAPSDAVQGAAIAAHANHLNVQRLAIINRDDAYGNGLRDVVFNTWCADKDCDEAQLYTGTYKEESAGTQMSGFLVDLQTFNPDMIVLVAFEADGTEFLNLAYNEAALTTNFVLPDGVRKETVITNVLEKRKLCDAVGTNPASPNSPEYKSFAIRYKGKFGTDPSTYNANAYDGAYLLGYAIATALGSSGTGEVSGAAIAKGLKRLSSGPTVQAGTAQWGETIQLLASGPDTTIDFKGASGDLQFDNTTGEAGGAIESWVFDLTDPENDPAVQTIGIMYTEDGVYQPPEIPTPETGLCAPDPPQ